MKLLRYGPKGQEKPGLLDGDGNIRDLSAHVDDIAAETLSPSGLAPLAALEAATGVKPTTIGKPGPILYQQALALLGIDPNATIAIGDRLDTDILGAVRTGIRSLMVLTGVSSKDDIAGLDYQPTWIMQDLRAVTKALTQLQ